jgi:hypothetical protein
MHRASDKRRGLSIAPDPSQVLWATFGCLATEQLQQSMEFGVAQSRAEQNEQRDERHVGRMTCFNYGGGLGILPSRAILFGVKKARHGLYHDQG